MPNVGSWNGRWTGEENKYYIIENVPNDFMKSKDHFTALIQKGRDSWLYSWNDGWTARITAEVIDSAEAKKRRKSSEGFCGYEWMVKTIKLYGKPMNTAETERFLQLETATV